MAVLVIVQLSITASAVTSTTQSVANGTVVIGNKSFDSLC